MGTHSDITSALNSGLLIQKLLNKDEADTAATCEEIVDLLLSADVDLGKRFPPLPVQLCTEMSQILKKLKELQSTIEQNSSRSCTSDKLQELRQQLRKFCENHGIYSTWRIDAKVGLLEGAVESSPEDGHNNLGLAHLCQHLFDLLIKQTTYQLLNSTTNNQAQAMISPSDAANTDSSIFQVIARTLQDLYLIKSSMVLDVRASKLEQSGSHQAAVELREELISLTQEIVNRNRENLAFSLSSLEEDLRTLERFGEAAATGEEIVQIRRTLVKHNRGKFLPNLAYSLDKLAGDLEDSCRPEDAVRVGKEVIDLYQELVDLDRETYLPELAQSYNNLEYSFRYTGKVEEVLEFQEKAVRLWKELVEKSRDTHLPGLNTCLMELVNILNRSARFQEAMQPGKEAVDIGRELVEKDRVTYLPKLAKTLHNMTFTFSKLERFDEAVEAGKEAVTTRQELVTNDRDNNLADLASSLSLLGSSLDKAGRIAEAMEVTEELVNVYKELMKRNREKYLPQLAQSYSSLSEYLLKCK